VTTMIDYLDKETKAAYVIIEGRIHNHDFEVIACAESKEAASRHLREEGFYKELQPGGYFLYINETGELWRQIICVPLLTK